MAKWALLATAALLIPAAAQAQTTAAASPTSPGALPPQTDGSVSEVIVTANKRSERLIDVAQSVTAVSGGELQTRQILKIEDLAAQVPGLAIQNVGARANRIIIRGLNSGGAGALVAAQLDETAFSTASGLTNAAIDIANLDTFDLERVEILRGPQGTLYGSASEGGLIKYVTNAPKLDKSEFLGEVGAYGVNEGDTGYSVKGAVNLPLIRDKLALRVTGSYQDVAGYIDNPLGGQTNNNGGDKWFVRASLLAQPTDKLSLRFTYNTQRQSFNGNGFIEVVGDALTPQVRQPNELDIANGGKLIGNFLFPNGADNEYTTYNLTISWDTPFANILSSSSHGKISSVFRNDVTNLNAAPGLTYGVALAGAFGQMGIGLDGRQTNSNDKWDQEVRISSLPGFKLFGHSFEWLGGFFYTHEDITFTQFYDAQSLTAPYAILTSIPQVFGGVPTGGSTLPGEYEEYAGFGSATYHFTDRFDLTFGGRYSSNSQRSQVTNSPGVLTGLAATRVNPPFTSSEDEFTWSVAPRFHVTPDTLLYFRAASGYRPGGPALVIPGIVGQPDHYNSDSTVNYEGGFKGTLLGHMLDVDIALFRIDWDDIQLLTSFVPPSGVRYTVVGNGGSALSQGVEWELTLRPMPHLSVSWLGAYTDAHLTSDAPAAGGVTGSRLAYVPDVTSTINIDYRRPWVRDFSFYVGGSASYIGSRVTDFQPLTAATSSGQVPLPSYWTLAAQAGIENARYGLHVYAQNLTDERGISTYSTSGAVNNLGEATIIQPRTIGVRATFKY